MTPPDSHVRQDRPRADSGDAGTAAAEEAVRACVIASSCVAGLQVDSQLLTASRCLDGFGYRDWPRLSYTMAHTNEPSRRLVQCAKSFTTCGAFFKCYGGNWIGLSLCREGGSCMGNRLVTMQNNVHHLDCSAYKAKCVTLPTGAIRGCCAVKTCGGTASTTCNGARGTRCMLGISFEFDCAPTDRVCTTDPYYFCVGKGSSCPVQAKPKCSGSKATYCAGGRLSSYDCSKNPFRGACDDNSLGMPCKPADSQCAPSWKGRCDGKRVSFCLDGSRKNLECVKLGFSGCKVTDKLKVAHCH